MSKIVIDALDMYLNSVFLSALVQKQGGKVTFTIGDRELHKVRKWDEENTGRD